MKYIFVFANVVVISEIVSFFPIYIATIVKEKFIQNTNTAVFMATKPGRMVSYINWLLNIKLHFHHMVLQDHMTNQNYISMTYNEEFTLKVT